MAALNKSNAKARIKSILGQFKKLTVSDSAGLDEMSEGKIYELYVLGRLLTELKTRGFTIRLVGSNIQFKSAPGLIKMSDPHFEVYASGSALPNFKIYTDIEFRTLGADLSGSNEKCSYHEVDIAVVEPAAIGRPAYKQIALAVECKAHANFTKGLVKQALGIRRELSLLTDNQPSVLSTYQTHGHESVPARPASEFWFVYIDPKGDEYKTCPSAFGVTFKHWQP